MNVLSNEPVGRLWYGDIEINYQIANRERVTRRVLIKVHPDCRVEVHAPESATLEAIHHAVKQRARWIAQQLAEFEAQLTYVTPRCYVSGESYYYLGKQYLLKVIEDPLQPQQVKLLRGKIQVYVHQKNAEVVKGLLKDWYKKRAKEVFQRRLEAVLPQALWVVAPPTIRIQTMQKQWGSCSPEGRITLNPNLVKAKRDCVDYVILHELCHLAEHNHSEHFYRLIAQVMPNWQVVKKELDDKAAVFLGCSDTK